MLYVHANRLGTSNDKLTFLLSYRRDDACIDSNTIVLRCVSPRSFFQQKDARTRHWYASTDDTVDKLFHAASPLPFACSLSSVTTAQLRVRERILSTLCLMVYSALSGLAPSYITELCVPVASIRPRSSLRSAAHGTLFVPRTRLELGKRAFAVAAPAAWNSLPDDVRSAPDKFKQCLKTHLFIQSYYSQSSLSWAVTNYDPTLSVRRSCNVYWHVTAPYKLSFINIIIIIIMA